MLNIVKFGITNSTCDNGMTFAVTSIFKTDELIHEENYRPLSYRPISYLSAGSKFFERILQKQIAMHIRDLFESVSLQVLKRVLCTLCNYNIARKMQSMCVILETSAKSVIQ